MKEFTIKVKGSGPDAVIDSLKEVEQAILSGCECAQDKGSGTEYQFVSSGEYDK